MKKAWDTESQRISPEPSNDFQKLFSKYDHSKFSSFMKLFLQEQQKYINSSGSTITCYHKILFEFCTAKSSAYKNLHYDSSTGSGFLVLPSLRTLRDYKNYCF